MQNCLENPSSFANFDLAVGYGELTQAFPLGGSCRGATDEGLSHKDFPLIRRLRRHLPPRGKANVYPTDKLQFIFLKKQRPNATATILLTFGLKCIISQINLHSTNHFYYITLRNNNKSKNIRMQKYSGTYFFSVSI